MAQTLLYEIVQAIIHKTIIILFLVTKIHNGRAQGGGGARVGAPHGKFKENNKINYLYGRHITSIPYHFCLYMLKLVMLAGILN